MADSGTQKAVEEHVRNMGIPASTGRHILDAAAVVEEYLKAQEGIAQINKDADAAEAGVRAQMKAVDEEMYRRRQELKDEESRRYTVLNNCLASVQSTRKHNLEPLYERVNHVERIIAMLRVAETIQPVNDIEDGEITTFHGEYLEMLGYLYNDDYLKIRLLITENRKLKNKYSLLAYGRCALNDETLIGIRNRAYTYGTPNLNERERYDVRLELGSFPSIQDAKAYARRNANKPLKQFIDDYVKLKEEYLEVTATYKLSDFERITAQDKEGGE